jgi:hypothetical protein
MGLPGQRGTPLRRTHTDGMLADDNLYIALTFLILRTYNFSIPNTIDVIQNVTGRIGRAYGTQCFGGKLFRQLCYVPRLTTK